MRICWDPPKTSFSYSGVSCHVNGLTTLDIGSRMICGLAIQTAMTMVFHPTLPLRYPTPLERLQVEALPLEGPPWETRPLEARPLEARPLEARPLESLLQEGPPWETRPQEGPPLETRPLETRLQEGPPWKTRPHEGRPLGARPLKSRPQEGPPTVQVMPLLEHMVVRASIGKGVAQIFIVSGAMIPCTLVRQLPCSRLATRF